MTRYVATGNGITVPLSAKTVDEIVRGGSKFEGWQTFNVFDTKTCDEVAVMVDIEHR
jgi:uncharacterized protein (DUF2126 family)